MSEERQVWVVDNEWWPVRGAFCSRCREDAFAYWSMRKAAFCEAHIEGLGREVRKGLVYVQVGQDSPYALAAKWGFSRNALLRLKELATDKSAEAVADIAVSVAERTPREFRALESAQ